MQIRAGHVPDRLHDNGWVDGVFQRSAGAMLFGLASGPRFLIEHGCSVTYERNGASDRDLLLLLLGSAFGIICYQRELLPIHASAVVVGDKVHAFTGDSGAGKSTLSAALADKGYPFFTDDVLVIDPAERGAGVTCYAGPKDLKLWSDALTITSARQGGKVSDLFAVEKFYAEPSRSSPRPSGTLASLYLIDALPDGNAAAISVIQGAGAMASLLASVYRPVLGQLIHGRGWMFGQLASLAGQIAQYRFSRTRNLQAFEASLGTLRLHLDQAR